MPLPMPLPMLGRLLWHARLTGRHLAPHPQHYCALRARHKYLCAGELRELPNAARKKESVTEAGRGGEGEQET